MSDDGITIWLIILAMVLGFIWGSLFVSKITIPTSSCTLVESSWDGKDLTANLDCKLDSDEMKKFTKTGTLELQPTE